MKKQLHVGQISAVAGSQELLARVIEFQKERGVPEFQGCARGDLILVAYEDKPLGPIVGVALLRRSVEDNELQPILEGVCVQGRKARRALELRAESLTNGIR